jgi:chemotaxis protein MotB
MTIRQIAISALTILTFTGCVSQKKYKSLQTGYTQLQLRENEARAQAQQCGADLASARTRITSLEEQLSSERKTLAAMQDALNKCLTSTSQGNVNISKLVDEINSSNSYIKQLIAAKGKSDSLNTLLTNNLTRSLSRDEMKDVNVEVLKGVVYISLADNMLYKSGSAEISGTAGTVLSKIAKIITDYGDYDVLVEGNTDNVPIAKGAIRNNWDLSALRAVSVVMALQNNYNVDPKRMTAGGRGEYNPLASNDTEQGRARNRRTQIIVTPKLDQFMDLIDKSPKSDSTDTEK